MTTGPTFTQCACRQYWPLPYILRDGDVVTCHGCGAEWTWSLSKPGREGTQRAAKKGRAKP